MISVDEALAACLALVAPGPVEEVALAEAAGRVLRAPVVAARDQPPFAASAMDGYAVRDADAVAGATLRVIGESAAGHGTQAIVAPGLAVRIFTGAPMPEGAERVVIQEDVTRNGDVVTLSAAPGPGRNLRPAGADFRKGDTLSAPRRLRPTDLALAAAMNAPRLKVARRPEVAVIVTGDELVSPGGDPRPDQIISSNGFALKAMIEAEGGAARLLPIARDDRASLEAVFALASGADIVVTVGGASVGDHDLVGAVAAGLGMERSFYKIAMRPGKPLIAGRLGGAAMLGLPGNPVSALVCAHLFLVPMLRAALGLPAGPRRMRRAALAVDLPPNGPRAHYMRAEVQAGTPLPTITPFGSQDSSLLSILGRANGLLLRPVGAAPVQAGAEVPWLPLGPIRDADP